MKLGIIGLSLLTGRLAETTYDFLDTDAVYVHDKRDRVEDYLEIEEVNAEYATLEKMVDDTDLLVVDKDVNGKDLKGYQGRIIVATESVDEKTQALYENFGGYTCQVMGLDNIKTRRLQRLLKKKMQMMDSCSVERVEAEVLGGQIMPVNIRVYTSEGEKRVIDYPEVLRSMKVTQEEIDEIKEDVVGEVERYHALREVLMGIDDGDGRYVMSVPYGNKCRGQPVIIEGNKIRVVESAIGELYSEELLHDGYGMSEKERFERGSSEIDDEDLGAIKSIDDVTDDYGVEHSEDSGVREILREMEANPRMPAPSNMNKYLTLGMVGSACTIAGTIIGYLII